METIIILSQKYTVRLNAVVCLSFMVVGSRHACIISFTNRDLSLPLIMVS